MKVEMDLSKHIDSAHKAFSDWKKVPFHNRQKLLLKLAEVLERIKKNTPKSSPQKCISRFHNPQQKSKKVQE